MIQKKERLTIKYKLPKVKEFIKKGDFKITKKAQGTAQDDFGFEDTEIVKAVMSLQEKDFVISKKNVNRPGWMDVYNAKIGDKIAYIKLTIQEDTILLIISFKEK
ncbi:MAG: type II toxin-antitoxin system MqsR family toxin [Spirochaetota bacterium]